MKYRDLDLNKLSFLKFSEFENIFLPEQIYHSASVSGWVVTGGGMVRGCL